MGTACCKAHEGLLTNGNDACVEHVEWFWAKRYFLEIQDSKRKV